VEDTNYSGKNEDESIVKQKKNISNKKELESLYDFSKSRIGMIFNSYFSLLSFPSISTVLTKPQSMMLSDTRAVPLRSEIIAEKDSLLHDAGKEENYFWTDLPFIPKNISKTGNSVKENLEEENYKQELPIGSVFQQAMKFSSELFLTRSNATRGNFSNLFNIDADAVTLGRNIFFKGTNDFSSPSGQALYAHELVHVSQVDLDPQLQRDTIPSSRLSMLEEEAAKVEKSFLDHLKAWGKQVNRSPIDMLGIESFVKNRLIKSFDPLNRNKDLRYIPYANDIGIVDSQIPPEISSPYFSSIKSPAANAPMNSGSLYEDFTYLPYRTIEANAHLHTQKTNIEQSQTPMFAASSRSINASASVYPESSLSSVTTTAATPPSSSIDIERLSDQVYGMILRRIKMERDRRGIT
jgi:hypothetical protein